MHVMTLVQNGPDGQTTEFKCPECGYHILLTWPPGYNKEILEMGDPDALHVAYTGGMELSACVNKTDPYLQVFEDFLEGKAY